MTNAEYTAKLKEAENALHRHINTCKMCRVKSLQDRCSMFIKLEEAAIKAWRKIESPNPPKR